ncbi:MAG TPA: rhomboid family intramembrane serine protease [Allosphingosinicella sp.]|jgi:membrane associated rhomboid family serine protease|nr:rhomboid family intramembrane serine protease [Allosphingosinicella sp.]
MRPPEDWRRARVTLAIAGATAAAFLLVALMGAGERAIMWGGFFPHRFGSDVYAPGAPVWLTPLTATLLHAGLLHLLFNLLIFVFCGRSTENVLGPASIAILYVVGAFAAAGGQYLMNPNSTNPMVGASGAIAAVIGAYSMLFGQNKVKVANPTLALWLNALWLLAGWIALNAVMGLTMQRSADLSIAVGAHIGGFVAGLLLARPLLMFRYRKA